MTAARRFTLRSPMPVSAEALYAWHARVGAFERLAPPWAPPRVLARTAGAEGTSMGEGARVTLSVPMLGPLRTTWDMEHHGVVPGREFNDRMRSGPFASWEHRHRMLPLPDGTSELEDDIAYVLPLGPLGAVGAGFAHGELVRTFRYRHALTRSDLLRHDAAARAGVQGWRIAVTGASGLVGRSLCAMLTTGGHTVLRVGRGASSDVRWDPSRRVLDAAALEGVDAVVHLAGENVGQRWTPDVKRRIHDSRVQGTRLLAETVAALRTPPRVVVSASAVGIYGDRGDEWLPEEARLGHGWLADVGAAWESALQPVRAAGIRTVTLRIGVVMAAEGGALARLVPVFLAGGGGPVGHGRQWMSWVSRHDLMGMVLHALATPSLAGAVNAVGPEPVTNAEFARVLGRVLSRPAFVPAPAFALRALFGEMADGTLLASQRVRGDALRASGFAWEHATLEQALRFELGRAG